MKCKACIHNTNEVFNRMTGNQKTTSIIYCNECGTLYLGTPMKSNFVNDIPSNSICENDFVYVVLQSNATNKHLKTLY